MRIPHTLKPPNVSVLKDWLTVIAILSAGIWAVYTLIEKNQREDVVYRGRAVAIATTCNLEIVGESSDSFLIKISTTIASAAKIRFYLFDSPYEILASKRRPLGVVMPPRELSDEATKKFHLAKPFSVTGRLSDIVTVPLEFGRLVDSTFYLEPQERFENVQFAYIGKKTFETFDTVSFVTTLVLAENLSRLGSDIVVNDNGTIDVTLLIYVEPKANYFALSESRAIKARISEAEVTDPKHATILGDSNVTLAGVACHLLSPSRTRSKDRKHRP